MKEIKFRGKRKDNGEWVYGYLVSYCELIDDKMVIIPDKWIKDEACFWEAKNGATRIETYGYEVHPDTVGQYTGKTEKYFKDIKVWEGDLIEFVKEYGFVEALQKRTIKDAVIFDDDTAQYTVGGYTLNHALNEGGKVIGNIHTENKQ